MREERERQLEQLRRLPEALEAAVAGLHGEQLSARPLAGEWSVAQIVHHLADAHMQGFVRCKLILTEDNPTLKPYQQAAWGETADAGLEELQPSLEIVRGVHRRWLALLESVPEEGWQRTAAHPERGTQTLADQLRIYANHGESHLEQIRQVAAAL